MNPLFVIIATQLLFTGSDVLARGLMRNHGFTLVAFLTPQFLVYFLIRQVAMFGQLYVFSSIPLGKTMAMFAAASIVLSNALGFLFFREVLSLSAYLAISLAIVALFILASR
jgi:multidrug transporter EmrE-like cation transporter